MPTKDHYHETVKRALIKDGWTITQEQFKVTIERRRLWIDVLARKTDQNLAILVEIKGFENSPSSVEELAKALGQYVMYQVALSVKDIDLPMYLAVPITAYRGIFAELLGQSVLKWVNMKLVVFDPLHEEIVLWVP